MNLSKLFAACLGIALIQISCGSGDSSSPSPSQGGGSTGLTGSLARFAIVGDHLYAVTDREIKAFDISVPDKLEKKSSQVIDFGVETIFGAYPNLFIGGQEGMYIYDVETSPSEPTFISQFGHSRACDPVVVENNYAFITLRSLGSCPGASNELKVIDISNIRQPTLIKNYPLTAPIGLSSNDHRLYICDGHDLKLFDSSDVENIQELNSTERLDCMDIIYKNNGVIVTSGQGITQYDVSGDDFELLSHLGF